MQLDLLGETLVDTELVVEPNKLDQLATAIGTASSADTARRVAFFGPTAAGQDSVIGPLQMDLTRTLQGGQSYEWRRSFEPGETVRFVVVLEDIIDKGTLHLATVRSEYFGADGDLIQRQRTVFVERAAAAGGSA